MPMPRLLSSLSLAAGILSGCGGQGPPVLHYASSDTADFWRSGLRIHPRELPDYAFTVAYLEPSPETSLRWFDSRPLSFLVGVRSRAGATALLDPVDFHLLPVCGDRPMAAIDPEGVIRDADRTRELEEAQYARTAAIDAGIEVPLAFLDLAATFVGKTPEQAERDDREYAERREQRRDNEAHHQRDQVELQTFRDAWAKRALRKTTLTQDAEMSGMVVFATPKDRLPADTLVLQWRRPDGAFANLGVFGRPFIAEPPPRKAVPGRGMPLDGMGAPFP